MTEAEIINQMFLYGEATTVLLQWWVGISFGLIGVSYFAAKRINLFFVVVLLLLYVSFSIAVASFLANLLAWQEALASDLERLNSSSDISATLLLNLVQSPVTTWIFGAGVIGTFLGCISYVIFAFVQSRRKGELAFTRPG